MTGSDPDRLVFAPTQVEARALGRGTLDAPVIVTGMGRQAVIRAVQSAADAAPKGCEFVLAGVAGGLSDQVAVGSAFWIEAVATPEGPWEPLRPPSSPFRRLCTVNQVLTSPTQRRLLHEATGADLVDLEGVHFVQTCRTLDIPCSIIRGVSDGVDDLLPANCERLIDERGRTDLTAVLKHLVRSPGQIPALLRLGRRTARAMAAVTAALE